MLAAQAQKTSARSDPTTFTEPDGRFQHSVPVSADVLKVLLETEEAKGGLGFASDSDRKNPAGLFRAVEIHLAEPDETDLVVLGMPPMRGADNAWFWLVRSARTNPKVLLFAGGDSLELLSSRTNGYRDIRGRWSSLSDTRTSVYHFDGKKYRVWKEKWTRNRR